MSHIRTQKPAIHSSLAGDPVLAELVASFVAEMPGRVALLKRQLESQDWLALRRAAHQLKGAAGSYGFDAVSPCAGKLEGTIRDGEPEEQIRAAVDELVDLCKRIRGGQPE
jgi:HPt (histidine-containing phosphotransfer) domain-containing protein